MSNTDPIKPKSAFFYGTLMAPQVLHRVCHGSTSPTNPLYKTHNLKTSPALLPDHRRHRVKGADYPAILPHPGSSVRGTYVTGLTANDIWRLDIFEGSEYRREVVRARILAAPVSAIGGSAGGSAGGQEDLEEGEEVEAETYVWDADPAQLEDKEWDFAEFQREKMKFWVGSEGAGEYAEIDEAVAATEQQGDGTRGRGVNGHITNALDEETRKSAV